MFEISWIAILVAAVAYMALGFVWYHPRVFGTAWMRLTGMDPEAAQQMDARVVWSMLGGFVVAVVVAFIFSHFAVAWGVYDAGTALGLAFWAWLGFIAPVFANTVLWGRKPMRLFFIDAGYWLVALAVIALVILYV